MDFYKTPIWRVVCRLERIAGFWPFQRRIKNAVTCALLFIVIHSFIVPLAIKLFHELTKNISIVVVNLVSIMVLLGTSIKILAAYVFQRRRNEIYCRIAKHLKKLQEEEFKIMTDYIEFGLKFTLAYIGTAILGSFIFDGPTIVKAIFRTFIIDNYTDMPLLPYHLEYGIDYTNYYIYIILHIIFMEVSGLIVIFAYDLAFVVAVQHNCALFKIASQRLKKALEVAAGYKYGRDASTHDEREAHHLLITAIDIHNEALELVVCIDNAYSFSWFFKLIETVISTGALLSVLIVITTDTNEYVSYLSYLSFALIQFNIPFNRGQQIIDLSSDIFKTCYDCEWDKFSKNTVSLLRIMMIRSSKTSYLTGGRIFALSNETYGRMLKAAFSYCTVFNSFVVQDNHRQ